MTLSRSSQSAIRSETRARLMRRTALGGVLLVMAGAGGASAAPAGASIPGSVARAPVIANPNANLTTVALKQSRTLINWSSFNIAQGQQVDFLFQNNAGIVLNRVNSLATINGKILGCVLTCGAGGSIGGNVWIYSPTGVIFGPHAQVNVGGLLATTSPLMSDQDFLDGSRLDFQFGGGASGAGVVVDSGAQLEARDFLALIAPSVTTQAGSTIEAGGTVLYGAAQTYVLHFDESAGHGLNLLDFEVPVSALTDGSVSATPLTIAGATTGGKVVVTSVSRPSVLNAVISLGGTVVASSASDAGGGDIVLSASGGPTQVKIGGSLQADNGVSIAAPDGGAITVSGSISAASATGAGGAIQVGGAGAGAVDLAATGRLDASSSGAGQSGGSVVVTAAAVQVDGAIAATGPAGGGTILVGGGAQGKDASIANAITTNLGADARLDASATGDGDGGRVVVWSNDSTNFQGTILSKGGAAAGDGGAAEVSSGGVLSYAGSTDLRAANGTAGQLLLDPSELTIVQTGGSGTIAAAGFNNPATSAVSTLGADAIDAALLTADVTISTHMSATGGNGVIAFNGGASPLTFYYSGSATRTLNFVPENGFLFTTSVGTVGPLNLTLAAGAAAITLPSTASILVNGGDLTLVGSNLTLMGDLAANQVNLSASGAINQTGGVITAAVLSGSSAGATSLTGANAVGTLANFTAGTSLSFTNAGPLVVANVSAAGGALNLTTTAGPLNVSGATATTTATLIAGGDLDLTGNVGAGTATLAAGGEIDQAGGGVTANSLTASATTGVSLTGANAVGNLGAVSNGGSGGVAFDNTLSINLTGNVAAAGQPVSLITSTGAITQAGGVITANTLFASSVTGLSLTGANAVANVGALANTVSGGISFTDAGSFTLTGNVAALGQAANLVSSTGMIVQASGVITASTLTAASATGMDLVGANQVDTVVSLSNSQAGDLSFSDNQTVTVDAVSLVSGNLNLGTTDGDLLLPNPINAPGLLQLVAARNLIGVSATSTAGPINLTGGSVTFSGAVNSGGDVTILAENGVAASVALGSASAGGNYSVTGATINQPALQPTLTGATSNLSIDFTNAAAPTDLTNIPLSAPGSVSVTTANGLTIGNVTAGNSINLMSGGQLNQPSCDECYGAYLLTAPNLAASAAGGIYLYQPNRISTVTSLTSTGEGFITFQDNLPVIIDSVTLNSGDLTLGTSTGDLTVTSAINAPGLVQISAAGNITVNGITTPSDIDLFAGGAVTETAAGTITLGGSYTAEGMTINPAAIQPTFMAESEGSLTLTFNQAGGVTDLTGTPLTAPGSVSVTVNNESLTVDSITAGGDVTLFTGGALAAAPAATISLLGSYSATGVTISAANPTVLQPTFQAGSFGSLSLTFNDPSGGTIDLTGTPLTAPGSVSISAPSDSLTVDSITSGDNVTLNTGGVLAAAPEATITLTGTYSATASTISAANPTVLQPSFSDGAFGDLDLTFNDTSGGTIDLTGTPLSAPGSVSVTAFNDSLTVDSITANSNVTLFAAGVLAAAPSATITLSGSYSATASTISTANPTVLQPTFNEGAFGSLSLTFNDTSGGTIDLTEFPLSAPGSVTVSANSDSLITDAITSTGGGVAVSAQGALTTAPISSASYVSLSSGGAMTAGSVTGGYYVSLSSGGAMNTGSVTAGYYVTMQAGGALNAGVINSPYFVNLQSGGAMTVNSITASSDVTLSSGGVLSALEGAVISVGGNYSATAVTIDPTNLTVLDPTFTGGGSLSLTFTENLGDTIDLTGIPLSAPGSVSVTASNESLTVDSITAGANGNVTLSTPGALGASDTAVISLGGSYSATGDTISSALWQPTFPGSTGSLSLTFTQSGGTTDLTGVPLTAPGTVSVSAPNENLTVASITAGEDVDLNAGGALNAAPSSTISVGANYNATAVTIGSTLLEPTFQMIDTFGNLNLTFTGGGTTDLTGFALTAPGSLTINATGGNLIVDNLTATTLDVILNAAGTLLTNTISAGADVNLTSGGNLTVGPITSGGNVSLNSSAAIIAQEGATVSLFGNYSATGVSIDPNLLQPMFQAESSGSLSLTFNTSGGAIDLTAHPLTAPGSVSISAGVEFESSEDLNVGAITAGNSVDLTSTGKLTQTNGTVITAGLLSAFANNGITLDSPNAVGALGELYNPGSGGISFTNAGDLVFTSYVYAPGQTVNLVSISGALTESEGAIYAGLLTATAVNGINLNSESNQVNTLGPIINSASGGITFFNGIDVNLVGDISAPGQTVNLGASGALNQSAGVITGATLIASAVNGVTLNDANAIAALGAFSNASTGGISFTNAGDFTLTDNITATGQTVNLVSLGGAITQSEGVIVAQTFSGAASTGLTLNDANFVNFLGPVSNTTSGGISFNNVSDLNVVADVTAANQSVNLVSGGALTQGVGVITAGTFTASAVNGISLTFANEVANLGVISNSGSGGISFTNGGSFTLVGAVTAASQNVNLISNAGSIGQTGGLITSGPFSATAVTGLSLTMPNLPEQIGVVNNQDSGGLAYTTAGGMLVTQNISAFGQTVSLTSITGAVAQIAGETITSTDLSASSSVGVNLTNANVVTNLGTMISATMGGINFADTVGFGVVGGVLATGQTVNLTASSGAIEQLGNGIDAAFLNASAVTGVSLEGANAIGILGALNNTASGGISIANDANLILNGNVDAPGQVVTLFTGIGAISQTSGTIKAATLNATADTGIALNDPNTVANLGSAINISGGGISVADSNSLTLVGNVDAFGQSVSLVTSAGALTQSSGVIATGTFSASAMTGITLTDINAVANLGALVNPVSGGIAFTNFGDIDLTVNLAAAGQTVSLTSLTGALTQTGGQTITAGLLNASALNGVTFDDANMVANLGVVSNSGTGGISFIEAGSFGLTGAVTAAGQSVNLVSSGGSINQTGGIITAGTLTAQAITGLTLNGANAIAGVGALTNAASGGISFTDAAAFVLTDNVTAPGQTVNLVSTGGSIDQTGGIITANSITGSAATSATFGGANQIDPIGPFTTTTGFSFTNATGFSAGGISGGTFVTLTALTGDLTLTGNIAGAITTLAANAGAIVQTGGVISGGVLNASAVTGITLNDANTATGIGALSNTTSGGISVMDAGGFNLTGVVSAPGQALDLTSAGALDETAGSITAATVDLNATGTVGLVSLTATGPVTIVAGGLNLTPASAGAVTIQTPTLVIESRSGLIDLGDNIPNPSAGGMTISSAQFSSIQSDNISLYAGYFAASAPQTDLGPQSTGAIKVGNLTWNVTGLTNPEGGANLSLFAGPGSTVQVTGAVSPSVVGSGNLLIGDAVADAWTPKDIDISGSIGTVAGTSNTKVAEVNSVELNAVDDVLMGSSAFQSAIDSFEASGHTLLINVTSETPFGVIRTGGFNAVFIGSNTLTVRGQGVIASQNTGAPGAQPVGIVLTNDNKDAIVLSLGSTQPATAVSVSSTPPPPTSTTPEVIDLFGTLTDSTGAVLISKAVADSTAVSLLSPLAITQTYRVNGCVIGEMNVCTPATGGIPTKLIQGITLATTTDVAPVYTMVTPLLTNKPADPVGDPTITGVGNEEIWRGPSCDPKGDGKCP